MVRFRRKSVGRGNAASRFFPFTRSCGVFLASCSEGSIGRNATAHWSAARRLTPESKPAKEFRLGLRDLGYSEGRDILIEWRSAGGNYDRLPSLIENLLDKKVDVIVQDSTVGTELTKRATSTVPIVMALVLDPVGSGLVKALAHPGENVTGLSMMATELYPKRMQLLREVKPQLERVAVLWNPDHPFHAKAGEELKRIAPHFQ